MAADELQKELQYLFGHDDFRPGQREIVESALTGVDTLAVLPTGGGKSLTYQLPAMLLPGATLILSPLIALMKDQTENLPPVVAARATVINSSLEPGEINRRIERVRKGEIKLVYAAPERLRQTPFLHALRRAGVSLAVIDEAHCISQWGHDFRPDYRAVGRAIKALNPRSVLAVTATATPEIADDIEKQIGREMLRIVRPTFRDNLFLACHRTASEDEKLTATLDFCKNTQGAGLVYAGSRDKVEQLARMLSRHGVSAGFYHAGLPPAERAAAQDRFMQGEVRVMAATVAFGMGVDKSDIRFILHFHPSRNLENYYQEAGRAGRDGLPAQCVILYSTADATNASRHLREETLTLQDVRGVYNAIQRTLTPDTIGPIDMAQLTGGDEAQEDIVRSVLPLLEEAEMLVRYTDIPRRMSLNPLPDNDALRTPDWLPWANAIGDGGDFTPQYLATHAFTALPELEAAALHYQDEGFVSYRPGPRFWLIELLPAPADAKARMETMLKHRERGALERVEAMRDYARKDYCRHAAIARYFGDRWPHRNCGRCDVCTGESPVGEQSSASDTQRSTIDPALAPIAALRAVHDLTKGFSPFAVGKPGLTRILRGTPDAPVKPTRTNAFGSLTGWKKAEVERLIDALTDAEYLRREEEDEYRRLYLTHAGEDCITEGACDIIWRSSPVPKAVSIASSSSRRSRSGATAAPEEAGEVDTRLYEKLRSWRYDVAQAENYPPYVVFGDKVLSALAARQPANEFDLLNIPGIGPAKSAKYGEAVLEIIRRHQAELPSSY
jgi:ATP-dependent DNA helicase RecQ